MQYASQLEMEGLWYEALFVLLHVRPAPCAPRLREAAIKGVLGRHAHRLRPAEGAEVCLPLRAGLLS